jgi:hypothetical protein
MRGMRGELAETNVVLKVKLYYFEGFVSSKSIIY